MYNITEYSKRRARELGVIIKPSKNKNKKIDVFRTDGTKIASIGDTRYGDYPTYINQKGLKYANERRRLFMARFSKVDESKLTPATLAKKILW